MITSSSSVHGPSMFGQAGFGQAGFGQAGFGQAGFGAFAERMTGVGDAAVLRSALGFASRASVLEGAFDPAPDFLSAVRRYAVMDQAAFSSVTQAGLSGLFGGLIDKPLSNEQLASRLWESAGLSGQGGWGGQRSSWWDSVPGLIDVTA